MAFDPQNDFPLDIETDLAAAEVRYLRASLLAGAVACIANDMQEWESYWSLPSEEVFREVEPFYNNEEPSSPETAATFLLFVREAVCH